MGRPLGKQYDHWLHLRVTKQWLHEFRKQCGHESVSEAARTILGEWLSNGKGGR